MARRSAARCPARSRPVTGWRLWHSLAGAVLKEVAAHSSCWAAAGPPLKEGGQAQTTAERWRQVHDLTGKGTGLLECSRRPGLSLNTVKRYARAAEPERMIRAPRYRATMVDPYRDHLRARRAADPAVPVWQLLAEIREQGYPGSMNLLYRYITQGRVEADRPHLSPRRVTRLLLTRPDVLSDSQQTLLAGLTAACPEMTDLAQLVRSFATLLKPEPANEARLRDWAETARASDLPNVHAFARGLDLDIDAAIAAVTLPFHNGRDRRREHQDQDDQTADVWPRRIHPAAPPHPARLTPRTVTTESETEPLKLQSLQLAATASRHPTAVTIKRLCRARHRGGGPRQCARRRRCGWPDSRGGSRRGGCRGRAVPGGGCCRRRGGGRRTRGRRG